MDGRYIEEGHFRLLYYQIMSDLMEETDVPEEVISDAISSIKDYFKWSEGGRFSDLDFNKEDTLCGYIDRYADHGAGLARCKILEALENCRELRSILEKSHLSVVSLGGGPGNDAIGFCSAMSRSHFAGRLVIHVVDKARLWQKCISMVRELLDKGIYGDTSHVFQQGKVALYFSPFTLPGELRYLAMYEFDIVLICQLISFIQWADKRKLIQVKFIIIIIGKFFICIIFILNSCWLTLELP